MNIDPKALESIIESEGLTLRQYFKKILLKLWQEQECFSGKRPLGNSGWNIDVAKALIKGGFVKGSLDEDGYVKDCDNELLDAYVIELIEKHLFK
jgi:hypothetical protein